MAKSVQTEARKLAVNVIESTKTSKLVGASKIFNVVATITPVGPTCPVTCWFHPNSLFKAEAKALGLKPCYTLKGKMSLHVRESKFEGADVGHEALLPVRAKLDYILQMHKMGRKVVDLIRWQTGGDILHPETGRPWVAFIDLILEVTAQATSMGIPVIGFTATWREPESQRLRGLFHASVQTLEDAALAISMGWTVAYAVLAKDVNQAVQDLRKLGVRAVFCPEQAEKTDSCCNCGICASAEVALFREVPFEVRYMMYRKKFEQAGIPLCVVFQMH